MRLSDQNGSLYYNIFSLNAHIVFCRAQASTLSMQWDVGRRWLSSQTSPPLVSECFYVFTNLGSGLPRRQDTSAREQFRVNWRASGGRLVIQSLAQSISAARADLVLSRFCSLGLYEGSFFFGRVFTKPNVRVSFGTEILISLMVQ